MIYENAFRNIRIVAIGAAGLLVAFLLSKVPSRLRERAACFCLAAILPVFALLILLQRVWDEGSLVYGGPISSHYEAVTSSVVRISAGSTCLAEVLPQYGCYGEFLAPLLKLFGGTVPVVTALFSLLLILALWASLRFAKAILRHPLVLLGGSLCLAMTAGFNLQYDNIDPALQYYPLRFVFPALSLLAAVWFQRVPKASNAFGIGCFAGAALAWNLESGLAVALSLAAFVGIGDFTARPWRQRKGLIRAARYLGLYALGALSFIILFIGYLRLKADSPVELSNLFVFQRVFALTGFGMIPIPAFPGYWTIHAAILLATLFLAATSLGSREDRDCPLELAAYLAVLGIALSAYYVGRSHILVLRLVMWPSVILAFFLLDRTLSETPNQFARRGAAAAAAISAAIPFIFFISAIPALARNIAAARNSPKTANAAVLEDIAFIRSRTSPGEAVGIIAVDQGVLYGYSGTKARLEGPSVSEMIRRADLDRLMKFLAARGPEKLFIGTDLDQAGQKGILGTDIPIDFHALGRFYSSESAPGGRLVYLKRRE